MFKIAIVVFRECLEIAFLLGVVIAATNPIKNSKIYIILGSVLGVACASVFALFARSIVDSFGGIGDELFNALVVLCTAILISFTVVCMQGYTSRIKQNLGKLSDKITSGNASKFMLVLVVAMTILREGAEIILFIYSIVSTEHIDSTNYILSLGLGGVAGLIAGTIIYLGIMNLSGKYIFKISTILLILIAAGLASKAAGIFTYSGILEVYNDQLWDSSWIISNNSIVGKILNIAIGYDSKPNAMQIIFYFSTIMLTITMMKIRSKLTGKNHD